MSNRGLLGNQCTGSLKFCEHCVFGKQRRVSFKAATHRTKSTLNYIHSDLRGPSRKPSFEYHLYLLTIIDDYSRKVWAFFLKSKDEIFEKFKDWKTMIEKQTERQVKRL